MRGLQWVSGWCAVHCRLWEQNLLCQRLPQSFSSKMCSMWTSHSALRGVWWDHSGCVHGQGLPCGMLSLWGLWTGTERRGRASLLPTRWTLALSLLSSETHREWHNASSCIPAPLLACTADIRKPGQKMVTWSPSPHPHLVSCACFSPVGDVPVKGYERFLLDSQGFYACEFQLYQTKSTWPRMWCVT